MALVSLALGVSLVPCAARSSRFLLILLKAATALVSRCASSDDDGHRGWWSMFELTADDARRGETAVELQAAHAHRAEHATSTAFVSLER